MEPYWSFFAEHWALSSAFVILLVVFIINEWRQRGQGAQSVSPQELVGLMNHSKATVLDVRDQSAFDKGHILGAVHIPASEFEAKKKLLNKYRTKPIVVVCQNGFTAPKTIQKLRQEGFPEVYSLNGGLDNWAKENLPLSKH